MKRGGGEKKQEEENWRKTKEDAWEGKKYKWYKLNLNEGHGWVFMELESKLLNVRM